MVAGLIFRRGDAPNPNRSYPPPRSPWIMAMNWRDLLFMHWPVEPELLRPFVPPQLEIETFDGSAWLGIVPFEMTGTRPRFVPPVPGLSRFPELNVRTYVRPVGGADRHVQKDACGGRSGRGGEGGVWFFSLDATSRAAVEGARLTFSLPYFRAAMSIRRDEDGSAGANGGWIMYRHRRLDSNQRLIYGKPSDAEASFVGRYRPVGDAFEAQPGTLERFLTDRYRLYSWGPRQSGCISGSELGTLYYGEIHHPPWPLQVAEADIQVNTMTAFLNLPAFTGTRPLLHYSRCVKVAAWWPRPVTVE
jgi:uncharacterized protein